MVHPFVQPLMVEPTKARVCLKCSEQFESINGRRLCAACSVDNLRLGRRAAKDKGAKRSTASNKLGADS